MALIPTTAHLAVVTALTAYSFTKLALGEGNRAVPSDLSGGWNVTALLTPFAPAREKADPPGGASGAVHVVDWQDGSEGDTVAYSANEVGLYATPAGGNEYLAYYESQGAGSVFGKIAGGIILRRFRIHATGAELVNATFNVSLSVPQATESIAGALEIVDDAEADADEGNAADNKAVTPAKWWRMFTGARIVARLAALQGNDRLNYSSLRNTPNLGTYATGVSVTNLGNRVTAVEDRVEVVVHTAQADYDAASDSDGKLHVLAV